MGVVDYFPFHCYAPRVMRVVREGGHHYRTVESDNMTILLT